MPNSAYLSPIAAEDTGSIGQQTQGVQSLGDGTSITDQIDENPIIAIVARQLADIGAKHRQPSAKHHQRNGAFQTVEVGPTHYRSLLRAQKSQEQLAADSLQLSRHGKVVQS